jgi:hypothetical protein
MYLGLLKHYPSIHMSTHWRIMLNPRLWNQEKYEKDFHQQPEVHRLAQSKGRCRMISCPQKGDSVSYIYKGAIVMKGVVDSDGFERGTDHQTHSSNLGEHRLHAICPEFAWIKISEVGLSTPIRNTGQRTWAKMRV